MKTTNRLYKINYLRSGKSLLGLFCLLLLPSITAFAEIEIVLNNDFIEKYKNRATINADFQIDVVPNKVHAAKDDGDIHIAARGQEVGLPLVAEIMNAKDEKTAIDALREVQSTGEAINLVGAWRIWCEHGGGANQIQGASIGKATSANPDHVFEIHPLTHVGGAPVLDSFHPIPGYDTKDAEKAFTMYEHMASRIIPNSKTTTIVTSALGYNYVEFVMVITDEEPFIIEDGRIIRADVQTVGEGEDAEGELITRSRRMVFVKDTAPEIEVRKFKKGGKLHVLGIPRIDLALVSYRAKQSKKDKSVLSWSLPYEIIVVGVYDK